MRDELAISTYSLILCSAEPHAAAAGGTAAVCNPVLPPEIGGGSTPAAEHGALGRGGTDTSTDGH